MKNNVFNLYVSYCLKKIEKELTALKKHQKPESFHQLRVQIKKLRALFHFIQSIYSYPGGIIVLKSLFKKAGEIRELQINRKLLQELHNPPSAMIIDLERKEKSYKKTFVKNIPAYTDIIKRLSITFDAPLYLPKKKIVRKFFKKQIRKAVQEFNKGSKKSLHQLRTELKTLMYVYKALPDNVQKSLNLDEPHINKLQEKLGLWHDTYAAISFFSRQQFKNKHRFISKLKVHNNKLYRDIFRKDLKLKSRNEQKVVR